MSHSFWRIKEKTAKCSAFLMLWTVYMNKAKVEWMLINSNESTCINQRLAIVYNTSMWTSTKDLENLQNFIFFENLSVDNIISQCYIHGRVWRCLHLSSSSTFISDSFNKKKENKTFLKVITKIWFEKIKKLSFVFGLLCAYLSREIIGNCCCVSLVDI